MEKACLLSLRDLRIIARRREQLAALVLTPILALLALMALGVSSARTMPFILFPISGILLTTTCSAYGRKNIEAALAVSISHRLRLASHLVSLLLVLSVQAGIYGLLAASCHREWDPGIPGLAASVAVSLLVATVLVWYRDRAAGR